MMPQVDNTDRAISARRGRRLEYLTLGWNAVEGIVAVVAGGIAGSVSLTAFGIDSFIEVTSGAALLWRMAVDSDVQHRERNEMRALRIVGACFLALAGLHCLRVRQRLALAQSARAEHSRNRPGPSVAHRNAPACFRKTQSGSPTEQRGHASRCQAV